MYTDIDKNIAFYSSINPESLCSCQYCVTYRLMIRSSYPFLAAWLDSLGVDIEKPLETSPLEQNMQGQTEYCGCQYIMYGSCDDGFECRIADVTLRKSHSHPGTGVSDPHFVLEFFPIRLQTVS